ncbi:PREDICTED: adenylate cyclase type 2-like isoform X2 [Amphimedon queenslandica]|uniref:adenylate cyclase n=1 Tax=Amphimedon queenslandica TaxID=400682 RepID=A0A1X7U9W1_AMPQE|nr:PREDICTED: adenylate cyclase type 2-like isoform X2 [Amphimedon queenslandica]|eukprot:XP_019855357.1 PREDICTED: adenylate cyclase type 2-like isoform X2 [Amphimedon queenslandica]
MVRFQLTRKLTVSLLKKLWVVFTKIVNWNPGFLFQFRLSECKELYVDFLYTSYESQILWMFIVNAVYKAFLIALHPFAANMEHAEYIIFGVVALTVETALITLKFIKKDAFKKISYAALFLDLTLLLLFELIVFDAKSTGFNLLFSLTFLLNVTSCLQNSTFLTVFFIVALYMLNIAGYTCYYPNTSPGVDSIYKEIAAGYLILTTGSLVCLVVHFMISKEKWMAFQKIENNVITHLDIKKETLKQEKLLHSIFPPDIAKVAQASLSNELAKEDETEEFRKLHLNRSNNVSILFADIKGFTALSSKIDAKTLVETLNELFARFDCLAEDNNCMRIKILGDCYYCVSGLYDSSKTHAQNCVEMGLQMIEVIKRVSHETGYDISMRVGIHTGAVFSGLIGLEKWQFDVWSTDVNIANKMEATGKPGYVHISKKTYKEIKNLYNVEANCPRDEMKTYFVTGRKQNDASIDGEVSSVISEIDITAPDDSLKTIKPYSCALINHDIEMESPRSGSFKEGRRFGIADVSKTLGITRVSRSSSKLVKNRQDFIDSLASVVTKEHCNKLWKKFAHRYQLKFKKTQHEIEYLQGGVKPHLSYFVSMTIMSLFNYLTQLTILPRDNSIISHFLNVVAIIISMALTVIFFTQEYTNFFQVSILKKFVQALKHNRLYHYVLFMVMWVIALNAATIGIIQCEPNASLLMPYETLNSQEGRCDFVEYYLILLSILTLFVILPMSDLPFAGTLLFAVCSLFHMLIVLPFAYFDTFLLHHITLYGDNAMKMFIKNEIYLAVIAVFMVIFGMIVIWQFKYAKRINFLQTLEIVEQQNKVEVVKAHNCVLLSNLMPNHVVRHFLDPFISQKDLYYHYHEKVGVMFAAIPEFSSFYNEHPLNKYGLECLRLLNEIFGDFDQLLKKEPFSHLEKIKTIGSTYMIASGLQEDSKYDGWKHLAILVKFSIALKEKLDKINHDSFTDFKMRIGISHGPVVAGVIGAKKPQYDVWGDTVNLASRMESTGVMGQTQVVQETKSILQGLGFNFKFRGFVNVKGKGELVTYFILD